MAKRAKATYELFAEDKTAAGWRSAAGTAQKHAKQISGMMTAVFSSAAGAALIEQARAAIQLGDDLNKARIKAGLHAKEMSTLAYAARQSDVELDALSTSIRKMMITQSEAAAGSKAHRKALADIGLTFEELQGLKADQTFETIAQRISNLANQEDRARVATEIFGKAGADLLPMFEQGAEGIRRAREEAEKLGFAFSDEQLERLARADDAWKRLTASWDVAAATLVSKVEPALTRTMDAFSSGKMGDIAEGFGKFGFVGMLTAASSANDEMDADAASAAKRRGGRRGGGAGSAFGPLALQEMQEYQKKLEELAKVQEQADKMHLDALKAQREEWLAMLQANEDARLAQAQYFEETAAANEDAIQEYTQALGESLEKVKMEETWAETVQSMQGIFVQGIDNMINAGKFKFADFVKFIALQFAKLQIQKMFDNMNEQQESSGGGGGGGFSWGGFFSKVASSFGGSRDTGGRGYPGTAYAIGRGPSMQPEMFVPDRPGRFAPGGVGGSSSVVINNHNVFNGTNEEMQRQQARRDRALVTLINNELNRKGVTRKV